MLVDVYYICKYIVGLKRLKRRRDDEGRSKEKGLRMNETVLVITGATALAVKKHCG